MKTFNIYKGQSQEKVIMLTSAIYFLLFNEWEYTWMNNYFQFQELALLQKYIVWLLFQENYIIDFKSVYITRVALLQHIHQECG